MKMRPSKITVSAVALTLAMASTLPAAAAVGKRTDQRNAQFGIQSQSVTLVTASPSKYLTGYQKAISYLTGKVQASGAVLSGSGQPASTADTAYTAVALGLNGQGSAAQSVVAWLLKNQNSDGGWGAVPGASGQSDLRDTALALWAIGEIAHLNGDSVTASFAQLKSGMNYLLGLQSNVTGAFSDAGGTPGAESNAIAVRALQVGGYLASQAGHASSAQLWSHAAAAGASALNVDNGIARVSTTDMLAGALWGIAPQVQAQREVGATNDLTFAYMGFGAKPGPGYFTSMDWINGVGTFNYAIAAARAGLPDLAVSQYNYGLTLQNADGGFGSMAHPPVGPETGSFSSGPNSSSVLVTAHYLLATHALLAHHVLGFGWDSASVSANGATSQLSASTPALDPAIPMQSGPRIAVLIGSPSATITASQPAKSNTSEANLQMNVAYELTQMGYRVTLFWYKPNQAEQFYNMNAFWNSLGQFQDVIASNGTFSYTNGFKTSFANHQAQFLTWLQQGGRFIDAGDNAALSSLGAQTSTSSTPVNQVRLTASLGGLLAQNGGSRDQALTSPATTAYYSSAPGYTVFASGQVGSQWQPVAVGKKVGSGRIFMTTLPVGSYSGDYAPTLAAMFAWSNKDVQVPQKTPANYTSAAQQLYQAMQKVYVIPGTNLYRELNIPQAHTRTHSYLWPFTQAFGGVAASNTALSSVANVPGLLSNLAQGLSQYYNSSMNPPGYDSYVVSHGGGTPFFDDNGWTALDLLRSYSDTQNQKFLQLAENLFPFLKSGWSKSKAPPGGEYFNTNRFGRTQTATGSVMDAALRLYLDTKNSQYLSFGEQAYQWDRTYVKGVNGLYNDGLSATGQPGGTPFTYDTGVVLQADVLLYRITNDPKYLARAQQLAVEGLTLYTDPLSGLMINNAGQSNAPFNEIFLRGLLMVYQTDHNPAFLRYIEHQANVAYRYERNSQGIYGINWSGVNDPTQSVDLLTQGGTLRLLGMLANVTSGTNQ